MSSFSFDSSVAGIFWTLTAGGKLVLIERRTEQDLNTSWRNFRQRRNNPHTPFTNALPNVD